MAEETSATCPKVSNELPDDEQQQRYGLSDPNSTTKHYQNLLEGQQRCGSPHYQEILPCKCNKNVSKNNIISLQLSARIGT
jgi:hypothetical protein